MEGEGTRMKKFRFSIWGLEWGADHDVEIVQGLRIVENTHE
jgi:hypothetical protein